MHFACTAAAAYLHHHSPQRVIPSASEGPAFRPHRRRCLPSPPQPAACHPEAPARDLLFVRTAAAAYLHHHSPQRVIPKRQRGTCFSSAPPPLPTFTTTARSFVIPKRQRGTCFSSAPPPLPTFTTTARSVSSRAPARDLLFVRTATAADIIRHVKSLNLPQFPQTTDYTPDIIVSALSGLPPLN